jgi:8-oxo-dGTP pyrophosphatase MutT (NUDIX family)
MAGETPEEALMREAAEETGLPPSNLHLVTKGVNSYNRYRYLLTGEANGEPGQADSTEVEWVGFLPLEDLKAKQTSGGMTFVDEFFEDIKLVIHSRSHSSA